MPSYESLHSQLPRKREEQVDIKSPTAGIHRTTMDNILGDPVTLATISVSTVRRTFHTMAAFTSL